ncbi:MAG: tetratricopeptide repeat protein [Bacteroidales bacterium]|nr:tetratricopeptide repeat protein [Bacteroidales bacterium]MCF8389821.1 tetratricopeptide repeat protein [Bacteroidales bacterium]
MKRICIIILSLFIIFPSVFSQQVEADSLRLLLKSSDDQEKSDIYIKISDVFKRVDNDSSLFYANMALSESIKNNDEEGTAESHFKIALIHIDNFESDAALEYLYKAENYFKQSKNQKKLAEIYNAFTLVYYDQLNYSKALEYSELAMSIAQKINYKEEMAQAVFYKGNIYNRLNDSEKSLEAYFQALELRKDLGNLDKIADVLNNIGGYYTSRSDFANAIEYYNQTLEIRRQTGVKRSIGIVLNNLGNQYLQLGDYDKAIENYREASEIFKEIKFNRGTAATLTGMAIIYENLFQYNSALDLYKEVLEIRKQQKDEYELANTLSNIGITYAHMFNDSLERLFGPYYEDSVLLTKNKPDLIMGRESISYNLQALEKRKKIGDNWGLSVTLANLGNMYLYHGNFDEARSCFNQWLSLPVEVHDDDTKFAIQIGLGKLEKFQGNYNSAIVYFTRALKIADKINKKLHIKISTENLSDIYARIGNYEQAFNYYKRYHQVYDSLNQERTRDQISEMQVKYESEAKEKENELLRKDQLINETKLKNSRRALIAAIIVVLIFVALIIQLIRQNAYKKKANLQLARKNRLITEQTKEITDSIQYASRIQNAILPPEEYIKSLLPEHFLIYRPRDIVSGDYYWMTEKNGKIITMVADCTGHGVPGAFMSMLGVAFLNEIISKHENPKVDLILNELRAQVIKSLHQTGKEGENQDGMDVSLYIIDSATLELDYAGANNPLIMFRGNEMIELKGDKMPIGIHTNADKPFTRLSYKLEKGDMLYTFSDGYPDQFGGLEGKKFMIKRFKSLLSEIHTKNPSEQKKVLEKTLDDWMKNSNQIDDIIVMGVRI